MCLCIVFDDEDIYPLNLILYLYTPYVIDNCFDRVKIELKKKSIYTTSQCLKKKTKQYK